MASWNDLNEGNELQECPVCMVKVCKKRLSTHLQDCLEKHKDNLKDYGLIQCPLYNHHVMPINYLNHHLECACEEALNLLRPFFQLKNPNLPQPPPDFLSNVPNEVLNLHNKQLLFYLKRDLEGNNISDDKTLYPDAGDSNAKEK